MMLLLALFSSCREEEHTNLKCKPGVFGHDWMYQGECTGPKCSDIGRGYYTGVCYDK